MKPFHQLSRLGKARRMRPLALRALEQYDLQVTGLELVGVFTNMLFRVRTAGGVSYLLRVCAPGWRTDEDLRSEAAWLQYLANDPAIGAPRPLPARSGDYLVTASHLNFPKPQRCMLMSWVPGKLLARHLDEPHLAKMGALFARLHLSSAAFLPPPGFTQLRLERVLARGEQEVLFNEASREAFSPANLAIFEQVDARVRAAYQRLYADPAGLRVIHHDLHHENINVYRGRLYPLDFEDTAWGYPVQDIAMALQDLWLEVGRGDYERLLAAFRRGYEELAAWPEAYPEEIDTLRAGRMLWVSNFVAHHERQHLATHVERTAPVFQRFLETGQIRKA